MISAPQPELIHITNPERYSTIISTSYYTCWETLLASLWVLWMAQLFFQTTYWIAIRNRNPGWFSSCSAEVQKLVHWTPRYSRLWCWWRTAPLDVPSFKWDITATVRTCNNRAPSTKLNFSRHFTEIHLNKIIYIRRYWGGSQKWILQCILKQQVSVEKETLINIKILELLWIKP